MSTGSALDLASKAAQGFGLLQCQECADNVRSALLAAGHKGQVVEIRGGGGRDFMICLSYDGGLTTITANGRHLGVRIGDSVFDNLHPGGVPFDQWLQDFDAIGGVAVHAVTDF